jgi:glucose-1-phosphate cytidylyltransferase
MKVVLLCGGQGTRLGEVTAGRMPKPLVTVNDMPILWHIMKLYSDQGFNDFVICAGHLGEQIKDYFYHYRTRIGDLHVSTATGETKVLGGAVEDWSVLIADTGGTTQTAGRLARIAKYLDDGPCFLTYGDGLADIDLNNLLAFHQHHGRLATVTGVAPPGRFGELSLDGDRVSELKEKPDQTDRYVNGGFMVLERDFVDRYCAIEGADEIMLERAPLERAAVDGELMIYRHHGFWQCMDTMRDWELLNKLAKQDIVPWQKRHTPAMSSEL